MKVVLPIILLSILRILVLVYVIYKEDLKEWEKQYDHIPVGDVAISVFFFLIIWVHFQSGTDPFSSDEIWFTCGLLILDLISVAYLFLRHILKWNTDKVDSLLSVFILVYALYGLFVVFRGI